MNAEQIATALGGRKMGDFWMARCPSHDDRKPSLAISVSVDGNVLVYCHAGCDQMQVISALRVCGLWKQSCGPLARHPNKSIQPNPNDAKRTAAAMRIWEASSQIAGTPVEFYLRSRGLYLPDTTRLRFHTGLRHPSGSIWPAMVAIVTRGHDDLKIGIHRTFLTASGHDKAPIHPQKMMLGPCRGGAVQLDTPGPVLMVGEGIETCLSASQAKGIPAWASLSTSGLCALDLPQELQEIIVLADGDGAGEAAAKSAAQRWKREGRRVRIARPPAGSDFNDVLVGCTNDRKEDLA
jgi:putative DNA primase/helicase